MTVRVLLADHRDLVRTGVRMILETEDDLEIEARNGGEAVAMARRLRPDGVLKDVRTPVRTGSGRHDS